MSMARCKFPLKDDFCNISGFGARNTNYAYAASTGGRRLSDNRILMSHDQSEIMRKAASLMKLWILGKTRVALLKNSVFNIDEL